jgi:hypothetical protein
MGQDKVEERLLLTCELRIDNRLCLGRTLLPRQRRRSLSHVRQYIEQVALFGVDDLLHLMEPIWTKSLFCQPVHKELSGVRQAPKDTKFCFVLEEIGQLTE